jgi:hypothetical protein
VHVGDEEHRTRVPAMHAVVVRGGLGHESAVLI